MNYTIKNESPLIMVGCQRSGTTLLANILASHPHGAFTSETLVFRYAFIWFWNLCKFKAAFRTPRLHEYLIAQSNPRGQALKKKDEKILRNVKAILKQYLENGLLNRWADESDLKTFIQSFCYDVYTYDMPTVKFWGDKYPEYMFHLDDFEAVFPDTHYIFIRRHPLDVMESLYRKRHPIGEIRGNILRTIEECRDQWVGWNSIWEHHNQRIPSNRKIEVTYEDFVEDPRTVLNQLSEFLNVGLLDCMKIDFRLKTIQRNNIGKWMESSHSDIIRSCSVTDEMKCLCEKYRYDVTSYS